MHIALVNNQTKIVENVVAPPIGANIWFVPPEYTAVQTPIGTIGDIWDGTNFIKPTPVEEVSNPEAK